MENSKKAMRERYHIKVNKKQKSINTPSHLISDDILIYNYQHQTRNFTNNSILSEMNDYKNNQYFSNNGINNNYLTEGNYPLLSTNKDLKYNENNNIIIKRFNKNDNKPKYTSIKNNKYKKKIANDNIGKKIIINKSETQYPFNNKKKSFIENDNNSMNHLKTPLIRPLSINKFNIPKKYNYIQNTEFRSKKYYLIDNNNNSFSKKHNFSRSRDKYSKYTFNKLRNNFYKPFRREDNDDLKMENLSNDQSIENNNFKNFPIYYNTINNSSMNIKNLNKKYKNNNNNKTKDDNNLVNIYKNKLINIFVRLIKNFFNKYLRKYLNELINNIRNNIYYNINNNKQIFNIYDDKIYRYQDSKMNYYYIKKNKINTQDNNILPNTSSIKKNFSSIMMYKKAIQNNAIDNKIYSKNNNNSNIGNDILSKKNSTQNIYIPVKNRNNNYNYNNYNYNYVSQPKDSIFSQLKINKSTRVFERNPNLYQNQNINTQINNFYNTNNSNFYINKINSFSSVMTIEKQRPKIFISKNNQKNTESSPEFPRENQNIKIKCGIFKNKNKLNNVIYKKILSKEKKNENENENNINNIFIKRIEKVYNNRSNKTNRNNINNNINISNQSYSIKSKYNDNETINNHFSTIDNYTNDKDEKFLNNNNIDISNENNNYNLEDIDKPMNIMNMKNDDDYEEKSISDEDYEVKNIIQMITSDRRLFLNFNYISFIYKNKNINLKKNILYISKINSFTILGIKKKENKNIICDLNNTNNNSLEETPEKINQNLNKYIKIGKIKSGLLKFDNLIKDKIYEYKSIFINDLKKINFRFIIHRIIQNHSLDIIKKYFDIFKNNANKEQNKDLIKERNNKKINKNIILDKQNINFIIDDNTIKDKDINNFENKEKLKSLIKKINNNDNEKENLHIINDNITSSEDNNIINIKMPLWKTVQDLNFGNVNMRDTKNIYLKKKVKVINDNNSNNSNKDEEYKEFNNNLNYQRKIDIFRTKLINYLFWKK